MANLELKVLAVYFLAQARDRAADIYRNGKREEFCA
jgi:hypothetical protein